MSETNYLDADLVEADKQFLQIGKRLKAAGFPQGDAANVRDGQRDGQMVILEDMDASEVLTEHTLMSRYHIDVSGGLGRDPNWYAVPNSDELDVETQRRFVLGEVRITGGALHDGWCIEGDSGKWNKRFQARGATLREAWAALYIKLDAEEQRHD